MLASRQQSFHEQYKSYSRLPGAHCCDECANSWSIRKVSAGTHVITVDAFDTDGNKGSITISVKK